MIFSLRELENRDRPITEAAFSRMHSSPSNSRKRYCPWCSASTFTTEDEDEEEEDIEDSEDSED